MQVFLAVQAVRPGSKKQQISRGVIEESARSPKPAWGVSDEIREPGVPPWPLAMKEAASPGNEFYRVQQAKSADEVLESIRRSAA
jgi:hypothetical protein